MVPGLFSAPTISCRSPDDTIMILDNILTGIGGLRVPEPYLEQLKERLRQFADDRDWEKFHSPKNLVMAMLTEAGELSEHFQWLTEEESRSLSQHEIAAVEEEIADVFIFLIRLADQLGIDIAEATAKKIDINEKKYPIEKSHGVATKYTNFD